MWDDRLDAKLLKLKDQGLSFAEIGERIGVSRNSALGRFQRLNGKVFRSQIDRIERGRLESKALNASKIQTRKAATSRMKAAIATGVEKRVAIRQAINEGATYQVIAEALEITKQRAHQIANN